MTLHSERTEKLPWLWVGVVTLLAVVLPRLAALGYYIYMDEGYHDYMARFIHDSYANHQGFPSDIVGFKLYQVLLFWVYSLPGNGTIWLRTVDLFLAAACCAAFAIMLIRESRSNVVGLLLALAFFTGMNLDEAIDSGYKNSFFPAFLCFFAAITLARSAAPRSSAWLAAGALTAVGVLFRETFVLFPIIGGAGLLFARNFPALFRYIAGGVGAALAIAIISAVLRGQLWGLLEFYFVYGKIYGPEESKTWLKFCENGGRALVFYAPLLCLAIMSILALMGRRKINLASRGMFWLACGLAPLVEPMLKIGFLYHFSACLPGLAGLCAYAYRLNHSKWGIVAAACAALWMQPLMYGQYHKLPVTLKTLASWPHSGWPASLVHTSTTLQAAAKIREHLPSGGTVSSSGFAYFVYLPSDSRPSRMQLADLSRMYIYSGYDPVVFRQMLDKNPPDVVLIAKAVHPHSATFERELRDIFEAHERYKYVETVEPDPAINYGWLGYHIYQKTP